MYKASNVKSVAIGVEPS